MPRKSDRPYKGKADLSALFGASEPISSPQTVPIDSIALPSSQPRRYFDPQKMEQLVQSVKAHGVLENLLIRPLPHKNSRYELVAGERRYRAAIAAGLFEVPVTVRELSDEQALAMGLVENLQREDLNPVEETEGILKLLALRLLLTAEEVISLLHRMRDEQRGKVSHNVMGNSQAQAVIAVFEELGLMTWESFVSNRLPLLNLPGEIFEALRSGKIAYTKATAIARVKDDEARQLLLAEAIELDLSLSQIRERLTVLQPKSEPSSPKAQFDATTRRLRAAQLWENPKKWKRALTLLQKLEALIEEE